MDPLNFGILSTAKIAREKIIPAIHKSDQCKVAAIASREPERAKSIAEELRIPTHYGTYEELLADDSLDAVYIPLPNHLHVGWSIKVLKAGKHVLCEKPIGLDADDARKLKAASEKYPDLKVMEAFMYRHHPRWKRVEELVRSGTIGTINSVHSNFSFYNDDPENYRNKKEMGGGALMDVGCYCVSVSRLVFGTEPDMVYGYSDIDPEFGTDRLTSGLLTFGSGTSVFSCSTQSFSDSYVKIYGTEGMIDIGSPFNYDPSKQTELKLLIGGEESVETFEACNQYTLQANAFATAVTEDSPVPISLDDSVANMVVLDRIRKGNKS